MVNRCASVVTGFQKCYFHSLNQRKTELNENQCTARAGVIGALVCTGLFPGCSNVFLLTGLILTPGKWMIISASVGGYERLVTFPAVLHSLSIALTPSSPRAIMDQSWLPTQILGNYRKWCCISISITAQVSFIKLKTSSRKVMVKWKQNLVCSICIFPHLNLTFLPMLLQSYTHPLWDGFSLVLYPLQTTKPSQESKILVPLSCLPHCCQLLGTISAFLNTLRRQLSKVGDFRSLQTAGYRSKIKLNRLLVCLRKQRPLHIQLSRVRSWTMFSL